MRVQRREMAARPRRDPSAECRKFKRLRKMTNRKSVRLQLRVERGTIHPGLNSCGARDPVHFHDLVQMHQIDRDRAAITVALGWFDSADHARAAAVWNRCNLRAVAPFEHRSQFFLIARKRNDVDRIRIVTPKRPPEIARSLAVGVAGAIVDAGRADRFERRRWFHARRAQIQLAFLWRRRELDRPQAKSLGDSLGHMLLLFGSRPLILVAPSPELSPAILRHRIDPRDASSLLTGAILRPPRPRGQTLGRLRVRLGISSGNSRASVTRPLKSPACR